HHDHHSFPTRRSSDLKRRFTADSNRSPNCETTERAPESINNGPILPRSNAANPHATARLAANPPTAPAQVFFGLTRGHSFGPPRSEEHTSELQSRSDL